MPRGKKNVQIETENVKLSTDIVSDEEYDIEEEQVEAPVELKEEVEE